MNKRYPYYLLYFSLLLTLFFSFFYPASTVASPERRVIFLLDLSGSMTWGYQSEQGLTFQQELDRAKDCTINILSQLRDIYPGISISFYTFGDHDSLTLYDEHSLDLEPAQALTKLSSFFSADHKYNQKRSYISYSIFQLAQKILKKEDLTTDDNLPEDASLFTVLVFTDGIEDVEPTFRQQNENYIKWLNRQIHQRQINWILWNIYQKEQFFCRPIQSDRIVYDVIFGRKTTAAAFALDELPSNNEIKLRIPPTIRLVPRIFSATQIESNRCSDQSPSTPLPVSEKTSPVQGIINWRNNNISGATGGWLHLFPSRSVFNQTVSNQPVPIKTIRRTTLRVLPVAESIKAVVPSSDITPGIYPVYYDQEGLCNALKDQYPNSSFVFPTDDNGELKPIGNIHIMHRIPVYRFTVSPSSGTSPDNSLADLNSNRLHIYTTSSRTFRVNMETRNSSGHVQADINYSVTVQRNGKNIKDTADLFKLMSSKSSGGSITADVGENITLVIPGVAAQKWWKSLLEMGFYTKPGTYLFNVRIHPKIIETADENYNVRIFCPQCNEKNSQAGSTDSQGITTLTLPISLEVNRRPLSFLQMGIIFIILLFILWIWLKWITRIEFKPGIWIGLKTGNDIELCKLSRNKVKNVWMLFWGKPGYVILQPQIMFTWDPYADDEDKKKDKNGTKKDKDIRFIVGVKAVKRSRLKVWCAHKPEPDTGERYKCEIDGQERKCVVKETHLDTNDAIQYDYIKLQYGDPLNIILIKEELDSKTNIWQKKGRETYQIYYIGKENVSNLLYIDKQINTSF